MAAVVAGLSVAPPLVPLLLSRPEPVTPPGRETQHPFRDGQDFPDGLDEDRDRA